MNTRGLGLGEKDCLADEDQVILDCNRRFNNVKLGSLGCQE
jgi:hypothetical protein